MIPLPLPLNCSSLSQMTKMASLKKKNLLTGALSRSQSASESASRPLKKMSVMMKAKKGDGLVFFFFFLKKKKNIPKPAYL